MKLVGMLDSPYVRRTAIALECLGVPFAHEPVSVFSTFEQFRGINPVVKAPTLICDDGEVLMDSSLILQYVEATRTAGRSLWPRDPVELQHDVRAVGLAYDDSPAADIRAFLKKHPVSYPVAQVTLDQPPKDFDEPRGLPTTYLIGPDGKVAKHIVGPVTEASLQGLIGGK